MTSIGSGPHHCVLPAPVGAAWVAAAWPGALADAVTLHVVEPAGTGRSTGESTRATVGSLGHDLAAVAAAVADEPVVLVGHSMNGTLCLAAAAAHPESFSGVVAICSPRRLPPDFAAAEARWQADAEPERKALFDERAAAASAAPAGSPEQVRLMTSAFSLRQYHDMTVDRSELDALTVLDYAWVGAVNADAATVDWDDVLHRQVRPVLVVLGRHDWLVDPNGWADAALPSTTLTVRHLEKSAHNPFVEEPDAFAATVETWLSRLDPRR